MLAYKIGENEIRALRAEAKSKLGAASTTANFTMRFQALTLSRSLFCVGGWRHGQGGPNERQVPTAAQKSHELVSILQQCASKH